MSKEAYARKGPQAILRAAARACRPAMAAEHVDPAICDQLEPERFVPAPAHVTRAVIGGPRIADLSEFGVWTAYAQQVQTAVETYDDPNAELDQIANAASTDWSLTDEERQAIYDLCSFGSSSAAYWTYYIPEINGGTAQPSLARQLVAYDVGGGIGSLKGGKVTVWSILGGAGLGSIAGLANMLITGEAQVQTPVYDICQYHPGAC